MKITLMRAALLAAVSTQILMAGPAFAQATDGAAADEAIIVTARRVEERLQDVPISITVVDQERLTKANISSADDLARVVPGLNVQSRYSSEQTAFSIRGFSQEARTSSSIGIYFGEVVAPRGGSISLQGGDGAGPGNLFDLQNVQVLKGPQGTLFGRNTTGGAVLLTPRKPVDRFEGYVEGSYGNYDMKRLQAVVNAPIADWARVRVGVDRLNRDGYMHNGSGIGPRDFADADYTAVRSSLVLDLGASLENYTIVSYTHSRNNGAPGQIFRGNPNPALALGPRSAAQAARLAASGDKWQIEQKLNNPIVKTKQFQVINTTTWTASDAITIKNIMSYSSYVQDMRQDVYATAFLASPTAYIATPFAFAPAGYHTNDQRNFTEELQLQGSGADGRLNYQAGLYYEHSTPGAPIGSGAPSLNSVCLISGFTSLEDSRCSSGRASFSTGTIEFINMAAYAQGTYALTDRFKVTAGVRYTYDRSRGASTGFNLSYLPPVPGQFVAPTVTGCATGYVAPACTFSARTSDKKPTWTLNLQYNPTDDLMVYGTYSRGYRQGAVVPFSATGIPFFGPEKLDNFELGTKLSLNGAVSGNIGLTGFYSKLSDQQLQFGLQNSKNGQNATSILNGGKSRIYGVELESSLRFGPMFRLDGSVAYINSKLQSIVLPSFPAYDIVLPSALAGDPLPFTPKWGVNVAGTFTLPTDESVGKIEFSAAYRYNSSWATSASNTTTFRSTPVKQIDLNLDWRNVAGQPIDLALFATNVTNQFTRGVVRAFYSTLGYDVGYVGQPRMYGVRARIRFGE
jgi:iron complex outermembrane receptor protein